MERAPSFRYGAVLLCAVTALVFLIVAPATDWARAVALALEGLALAIAVATASMRPRVQRARAVVIGGAAALLVVAVAAGALSPEVSAALSALAGTGASLALVGGLIRLVRRHGVTLQAVAGALAIYVQLGLIFAWLIGFVAHVSSEPYFTQGGDGSQADRVYFSFTVLTTTGFGDFTAAQPLGRGIAVVEMLSGQIYLVTVIGVLVGGLVGSRRER
ncbi:MAG TPA: potassium channel family protein [Solirubrobacteraceae bacterium]|nr:potassium channel family protein [Solirubrobacteraceae bacterium]